MRIWLLIVAFWLAVASGADGRDIYVNNLTGSDLNDGSAQRTLGRGAGPCRSLAKGLRVANQGDRLILANTGEPYRECVTLGGARHSGIVNTPFVIEGNGATLDGTAPVPSWAWEHFEEEIFRFQPKRKGWQMLFLGGLPASRQFSEDGAGVPALAPLCWCLHHGFVYFRGAKGALPLDYDLSFSRERAGLTLYRVRHVVIKDLIVQGFQLDGINAHDLAIDVTLTSVTSRGNGRSGVSVGGASRVEIDSCLIGNNGEAQVRTEGFSRTRIVNCDLLDNTAPAVAQEGGQVEIVRP